MKPHLQNAFMIHFIFPWNKRTISHVCHEAAQLSNFFLLAQRCFKENKNVFTKFKTKAELK